MLDYSLSEKDILFLKRCFTLAERALNFTLPNPKVGAIITNHNDEMVAEGWHERYGKKHAEVNAIHRLPENFDFSNSNLYVSLEPCCHTNKKTPPCVSMILEKKIPKVIIATLDPNPHVSGKGVKMLQEAGVHVLLAHEQFLPLQKKVNHHFYINQIFQRPSITLKWAESRNKIMGDKQKRILISHPYTQFFSHQLRAQHQAILVGKNTILVDQPQLNLRYANGKNPKIIILDSHATIDPQKFFPNREGITINLKYQKELENWKYMQVQNLQNWNLILDRLYRDYQIGSILVEGGSTVLNQILSTNLWDEAYCLVSPEIISTSNPVFAPLFIQGSIQYIDSIKDNQIFKIQNFHSCSI